jgi:hypothetical protein
MSNERVLSEAEACRAIGLSEGTLRSFVESGYLNVEVGPDGARCYSRAELASVFGIGTEVHNEDRPVDEVVRQAADTTVVEEDEPRPTRIVETEEENIGESKARQAFENATVAESEDSSESDDRSEGGRLTRIIELQDKLLELKDREIEDLKEQREWLRERVERLEEKSHRDQILMLSESQAIRELMIKEREKKSTMRSFIDWFVGKDDEKPSKQKLELSQSGQATEQEPRQNVPNSQN